MPNENKLTHEMVLQKLHAGIDMPEEVIDDIIGKYESMGRWLDREGSAIKRYEPFVSPQGSVLLGTANRPIGEGEEYDVDLICRLLIVKLTVTQKALKQAVGKEIQGYATAHGMIYRPEDKRRCWTLKYAEDNRFHVDILPCVPDAERYRQFLIDSGHHSLAKNNAITEGAVAITDKTDPNYERITDDWPTSNPLGFAAWFFERMEERLLVEKQELLRRVMIYDKVEDIPNHRVKTTLQKAIQLLKRHRDTTFSGDPDHKPISIIISTLSALAYNNEDTLVGALTAILQTMESFIENRDGVSWIANPVNPEENFADKWEEDSGKKAAFHRWLSSARRDFGTYLNSSRPEDVPKPLRERIGESVVDKVMKKVRSTNHAAATILSTAAVERAEAMAAEVHRRGTETQPWRKKD